MADFTQVGNGSLRMLLEREGGTIVVDFYADWCAPCRAIAPALADLATVHGAHVIKVNVDDEPQLAEKYEIQSIPTVIRFDEGREVSRSVGFATSKKLSRRLGFDRR